jgi:hypothetical protein
MIENMGKFPKTGSAIVLHTCFTSEELFQEDRSGSRPCFSERAGFTEYSNDYKNKPPTSSHGKGSCSQEE